MSFHVGIIMDGNGRWAVRRGLVRSVGHRAGAGALRRVVEASPELGITALTVYAFSADNWRRPADEVGLLLRLFRAYLRSERRKCVRHGVRVSVIGRRDRLPGLLRREIRTVERATIDGATLHLRIAVDYSSREAILRAATRWAPEAGRADFEGFLVDQPAHAAPPVDLLIRTGGEQRLSDFLLWESAYAELYFTPLMWPEFTPEALRRAVEVFHGRERRFGGLPAAAAGSAVAGAA